VYKTWKFDGQNGYFVNSKNKNQMKSIYLIRHAKSNWEFATSDKSRVISERGIEAAHRMGKFLAQCLPETFVIWSSTAVRAKETATIITSYFPETAPKIIFKEALYTFSEADLTEFIQSTQEDISTLILFGHNEAITNFVNKFGSISVSNVPTAGFVQLDFAIDNWKNLEKGTTTMIQFPTDLH
jgi:phosphohistidine phosphatase